jgi:hypothetical protein
MDQIVSGSMLLHITPFSRNIDELDVNEYNKFFMANQEFYYRTRQRVVSYWNCYYKTDYKNINEYPGTQILRFFESKLM